MSSTKKPSRRARIRNTVRARDIMSRDVICVPLTMTLPDLAATLGGRHVTGVGVVDETGLLVGAVSSTDVVGSDVRPQPHDAVLHPPPEIGRACEDSPGAEAAPSLEGSPRPPAAGLVSDIYSPFVVFAPVDADLATLAQQMVRHRVHRLFIQDAGRVAGVVTSMDLMRAVAMLAERARRRPAVAGIP